MTGYSFSEFKLLPAPNGLRREYKFRFVAEVGPPEARRVIAAFHAAEDAAAFINASTQHGLPRDVRGVLGKVLELLRYAEDPESRAAFREVRAILHRYGKK